MTTLLGDDMRCRRGRWLLLPILGLVLLSGLGQRARAQAVDDTSQTQPRGVEPAAPDSLPTADLRSSLQSSSDTGDVERVYVNADSLSTLRRGGERVQEMFGEVFVRQDTTQVRSEYALRYLNRDEVLFVDDVVIYERGDTLRADTVRYDRATEVGRARGHVRLTNGDVQVRSDRAIYYATEKRSVFPDSVTLVDSSRVLRARSGTYWSDEERAEFGGGVRLTEPGTRLLSDSLTYYRNQDRSIARGDVFVDRREEGAQADTTNRTYLFGDWVDNQEARRYSRVEGNALLVRVRMDSTGAPSDTLVVNARRLEAFRTDTHRRLVAVGDVRIWQPDLAAVADSVVYDRVVAATPDSIPDREVPIDTTRPAPDSLTLARTPTPPTETRSPSSRSSPSDSLEGEATIQREATTGGARPSSDTTARPTATSAAPPPDSATRPQSPDTPGRSPRQWDTPTAQSDSALPLEETRLFRGPVTWFEDSQVWGDSIRVRARSRNIDTVFVRGSAFAAQRDSVLDRIQQLKAQNIVAFFTGGTLRRIRARPNARAIRFLASENDSLNGAARTSGDRIELRFDAGSVERISVVGGTQTTYYRKNKNIPDPFELEGFQWTPDRRPRRRALLRDERVRRRLDLGQGPPSEPVAGPPVQRQTLPGSLSPPDSAVQSSRRAPRPARGPAFPPQWLRDLARGAATNSLRDGPVFPDSGWAPVWPQAPVDTSMTTRNLNP